MNLNRIDLKFGKALAVNKGFSLLELVVGLAIASIAMAAVVGVFTTLTRSYTTQTTSANLQQAARMGLDYMAQNIRMAGLNPKRIADVKFISATPTDMHFKLDRNLNGEIDNSEEDIAYVYNSDDNEVGEVLDASDPDSPSYPFLDNVTDLTFSYLDSNGDDLGADPDLEQIQTVEIFLTVERRSGRERRPVSRTYSSRVICRNLGL